jgi:acetyltransferase
VQPAEADALAPRLAELHLEAMRSGMALGAAGTAVAGTLTRSYHDVVNRLDERERLLLVAERQDQLVGMAQVVFSGVGNAAHRAEVQRVAVGEAARGAGIGVRLMRALEEEAMRRGVTLLWLTTHDQTGACGFYEAIGYTKLGVMPNYSRRPDGALWPGAFYFRELTA